MVKHWGDDGVLSGSVSEETNLSEVTWDTEMLIQCHANHAVEYGVSGFFLKECLPSTSICLCIRLSIYLKPSNFSSRKDDFHLPHCLERCESLRLAKEFSFFSKAGLFPEGWMEKGKLDYLSFTLTPFKNPTVVWGETSKQCQWLSWIYLIYQGRLAGNLFWEK